MKNDKDMVRFLIYMNKLEKESQLNEEHAIVVESNITLLETKLRKVYESSSAEAVSTISSIVGDAFDSLGKGAKSLLSKFNGKVDEDDVDDKMVQSVILSYKDELDITKAKHLKQLTLYTKEFWEDIFGVLGVSGTAIEKQFLKEHRSNLVDLRNESNAIRKKAIEEVKKMNVVDANGKRVNLMNRFKSFSVLLASKYKNEILKSKAVSNAMKEYKDFATKSYDRSFKPIISDLIQTMTIDYITNANKHKESKK